MRDTSLNSLTLNTAFAINSTGGGQAVQTVDSSTVYQTLHQRALRSTR